jgi:chromosome segregation ATPase
VSSDSEFDEGYVSYNTTEFMNAMSTAHEAASRLQDLHSKILSLANYLRRAKEGSDCQLTPLAELEQFFTEASESSCVSEIRIVGLRAAFQKVVATLEKALKDNQQLKRVNKKEEKKLSACLARATGLKSENEQLKESGKKLEETFKQQQKVEERTY